MGCFYGSLFSFSQEWIHHETLRLKKTHFCKPHVTRYANEALTKTKNKIVSVQLTTCYISTRMDMSTRDPQDVLRLVRENAIDSNGPNAISAVWYATQTDLKIYRLGYFDPLKIRKGL